MIYKGNSTYSSDCLYTVQNGVVYSGASTSSFNIIATIEGPVNIGIVACILGPY